LLDEPLSNLDAKLREQMRIELKRLQQQLGFTVLFVTHDQIEAMSLSTRLAVMNQGHIEQLGTPQEVYERPQTPFVEDFLGRILRFRGTVTEQQPNYQVVEFDGVKNVRVRVSEGAEQGAVGKKVLVAIRPEDVRVERDHGAGAGNIIPCDVENVLHLGREYELVLRVADRLCTITVPRESGSKVGQTIGLHLPAEHLRVWAATAALEATGMEQTTQAGSAV
jgi:ABC-type sugar transport system ATPase subunit